MREIKAKLDELGIYPNKKLGQNFLVSPHTVKAIGAKVAELQPAALIEIGPGLGALTELLASVGPTLELIELDRKLAQWWLSRGFTVHHEDAAKFDWQKLSLPNGSCLVSNLPYQISSTTVIDRSLGPESITHMVLMFQKEVAVRLLSPAGRKDYGLLSVMAQTFWQMETLTDVPPQAFFPPPQVHSRVVVFTRKPSPIIDKAPYLEFLKGVFQARRKQVGKAIFAFARAKIDDEATALVLASLGIAREQRAEEISPELWQELYLKLTAAPL